MSRSKAPVPKQLSTLVLTPHQLAAIVGHAEASYPEEACGLIVGRVTRGVAKAGRIEPSDNVAAERRRDRFEVDPVVRFKVERALRGTDEAIIGHYHSHPDHPALPSSTDLASAFEPEFAWVIVSVQKGEARAATAHQVRPSGRVFRAIDLRLAGEARRAPSRARR
ncbi:MAG: M67 family metallopeptidase [Alphaproteobacteria bacterium]|nr:M67 family metallopeptidase [Alphaproteobacteria bacterium]